MGRAVDDRARHQRERRSRGRRQRSAASWRPASTSTSQAWSLVLLRPARRRSDAERRVARSIKLAACVHLLLRARPRRVARAGAAGRAGGEADHGLGRRQPDRRADRGRARTTAAHGARLGPLQLRRVERAGAADRQRRAGRPLHQRRRGADGRGRRRRADQGRARASTLLRNQLAVVVPNDRPRTFKSIREIADPAFKRIAIGDPAGGAGRRLREAVPARQEGLWTRVEPRVVPSGSVRAALAAVESGAADAAIVYRTDARVALKATVAWVVPADRGPRIVYPGRDRAATTRRRTSRSASSTSCAARRPRASSSASVSPRLLACIRTISLNGSLADHAGSRCCARPAPRC